MSDILNKLEAHPNEEFLSSNHTEAFRWLLAFGMADELPPDSKTKPFIGIFDGCKSHWIVARVVRGDAGPGDDGLYVSCIPRSAISGEKLAAKVYEEYGGKFITQRAPRLPTDLE